MDSKRLGTPWLYERYLLNVHPWKPRLKRDSIVLIDCNMWPVQVWNVPLHRMSEDVGLKIGQTLGGMFDIIPGNGSKKGRYTRLKVMMNISKPLLRGK